MSEDRDEFDSFIDEIEAHQKNEIEQNLREAIEVVTDLNARLVVLNRIMITGKSNDIAQAASAIEMKIKSASTVFDNITNLMKSLELASFHEASDKFLEMDEAEAADLMISLRDALMDFSTGSSKTKNRAISYKNGLESSMRSMSMFRSSDGRLLAEG